MNKSMRLLLALVAPLSAGLATVLVLGPAPYSTATPFSSGPGSFLLLGGGLLALYVATVREAAAAHRPTAKCIS
jgi:hypothetical protein